MKKRLSFLGLLMPALMFYSLPLLWAENELAVITKAEGEAIIIRDGQTIPVEVGATFQNGDTIKTQPGCTVDICLNNVAGCRILPSSELVTAQTNRDDTQLMIMGGNAILNLKSLPRDSKFQVETPTAVAAVRGTQFWGRVELSRPENPVTNFAVREGTVEIFAKHSQKSYMIEAGQALDIGTDASVLPVIRPALQEELDAMAQADAIQTTV